MSCETDNIGLLTPQGLEFWISMTIQQRGDVRPLPPSIHRVAPTAFPSHRTELQTFVAYTLQASKEASPVAKSLLSLRTPDPRKFSRVSKHMGGAMGFVDGSAFTV